MPQDMITLYQCQCGQKIPTGGKAIGESLICNKCQCFNVIIRSKLEGPQPEQGGITRMLTADEKVEVSAAFDNIVRRRATKQDSKAELFKSSWIFVLSLLGPYMGGFLASANLKSLGKPARAKRVLALSLITYLALAVFVIGAHKILSAGLLWSAIFAYSFFASLLITMTVSRDTRLGFENGATVQSPLVPALLAVVVALAEGFLAHTMSSGLAL